MRKAYIFGSLPPGAWAYIMGPLNRILSLLDDWHPPSSGSAIAEPPTGLPMTGSIDVVGNPSGTDLSSHRHDHWQDDHDGSGSTTDMSGSGWHDPFSNGTGGGHDPWCD
jgi:hypothetical protein